MFALVLRIGFHIPIKATVVAIATIFLAEILQDLMPDHFATAKRWLKIGLGVITGVVLFIILRFLAAKFLGIYPSDTYAALNSHGGLEGIAKGHDVPSAVVFEVLFAFIFGCLAFAWVKGHRTAVIVIFCIAMVPVTVELALKEYYDTFMSREETAHALATKGVVGTAKQTVPKEFLPTPPATTVTSSSETTALSHTPVRCGGNWDVRPLDLLPREVRQVDLCWGWDAWAVHGKVTLVTKSGKRQPLSGDSDHTFKLPELQTGGVATFEAGDKPARVMIKNKY
jgi:hypothetical protein